MKIDRRLVYALAKKLDAVEPKRTARRGQMFRYRNRECLLRDLAMQLIYGVGFTRDHFGIKIKAFDGFIKKYGRKPRVSEIDLTKLKATSWVQQKNDWITAEVWW